MNIIFTMGLPASGKTTWSKKYCSSNNYYHCHFDSYIHTPKYESFEELIVDQINYAVKSKVEGVVFDHTFYSEDYILTSLDLINNYVNINSIEIHFWVGNREKCIENDNNRKLKNGYSCKITIDNAVLKYPTIKKYKNTEVLIMNHEILTKEDFLEKYNNGRDFIQSENWSLGGDWGNCWGDRGTVRAEEPPSTFERFDDLLLEICPNIGILMYKKLYNSSVTVEKYDEGDWYGGSVEYARYACDLNELYDTLIEYGLL